MQFYIYLSEVKVDSLYSQVPAWRRLSVEVGIKLGWLSATIKSNQPAQALAVKTRAVARHIRRTENVTKADGSGSWVFDRLPLKFGVLRDRAEGLAFFGNEFRDVRLVLIGHPNSLVGASHSASDEIHTLDHYVLRFLQSASVTESMSTAEMDDERFRDIAVSAAANALKSLDVRARGVEFLAKVIDVVENDKPRMVIATPLYVSLI